MTEALATPATHASSDDALVEHVMRFHGHTCPGAMLGIRISDVVLELMGRNSADSPLVAVVETNLCAVDPIQYLTGCTFGKRNLIHRDHGKHSYTFWKRSDGSGIRIVALPDGLAGRNPELWEIHERIHKGLATDEERAHFEQAQAARSEAILKVEIGELLRIERIHEPPPQRVEMLAPIPCARCGEPTFGTHLFRFADEDFCVPCAVEASAAAAPPAAV